MEHDLDCPACGASAGDGCEGLPEDTFHPERADGLPPPGTGVWGAADLDGDGIVGALDLDDPAAWL